LKFFSNLVDECLICFSEFWDITRFRLFSGGNDLVTTEEFKQLIDSGEDMQILDTMPYEDSLKKTCTRSHNGAAWAIKLGYNKVYRHPGGIFAWKGADFPIEKRE
jgi:hypothetical protein